MSRGPGVLIVGSYPPPPGGVPRHIASLAAYLARNGWRVHVLASGREQGEVTPGVEVHRHPAGRKLRWLLRRPGARGEIQRSGLTGIVRRDPRAAAQYALAIATARHLIEKNGIDVVSGYNLVYGVPIAAVVARAYRLPLVVNNLGEIYSDPAFFRHHRRVVEYACDAADLFLAPSRHCARSYELIDLPQDVEVIPHGIDIRRFDPARDARAARRTLGLPMEGDLILYFGRMVAEMGLDTVMAAAERLLTASPRATLGIAGGRGDLTSAAHALEERYPGRVFVRENVPQLQVPDFFSAATVLIAPTAGDRACGSLAAAEAMAAARPVVASAVGGVPEIVRDGETGLLVRAGDVDGLTAAVLELLARPDEARRLGRAGRARVEALWDEEKTNAAVEERYRALLGRNGAPTGRNVAPLRVAR